MTALEKLIKLASTDGAAHYRELAQSALIELLAMQAQIEVFTMHMTGDKCPMCGSQDIKRRDDGSLMCFICCHRIGDPVK